jgi:DNA-binding MarR family transcriptional regulator
MTERVNVKVNRPPFAMVSKFIFDYITDANAIKLYLGLYTWADGEGNCYPTFTQIEERIKMSRATISKSINILKREGLLVVKKGKKTGNLKANNIYQLETNLNKKETSAPSSNFKLEDDFPSSNSKLEPSSNSKLSLVQELNYNKNQLMIINNNNQERLKTSKPFFENLDKKEFIKQAKKDNKLCERWLGQKLKGFTEQYPRDFLKYYYEQLTYTDDMQEVSKLMTYFRKNNTFGIGNSLANWFKNWKPINNQANATKTFAQLEREDYRQQMKRIQETYDSFDDMLLNEVTSYE